MSNTISNAHTNLLLSREFNTNTSTVHNHVRKGGEFFAQFIAQLSTVDQLKTVCENQKGIMRYTQALNFALNGDPVHFNKVTAYLISTVVLTKSKSISFKDAHFLCGANSDNANLINGVSKSKLNKFIGIVGAYGTITSQVSRTIGTGGFFTALGISSPNGAHAVTFTDNAKSNALILAYAHQLERMTESTFLTIKEKQSKNK